MLNQALGSSSSPSRILRGSAMGSSSSGGDGEQDADGGGRVGGADQGLADQVADAALGDQDGPGGQGLADGGEAARVDLQGGQVAGVHPDQGGAGGGRDLGLGHGMDLDQGVQGGRADLVQQGAQRPRVEGGDDQQDGVGAPGPRLPDLVGGGDEVLAEHGQTDR